MRRVSMGRALAVLAVFAMVVAACGDDGGNGDNDGNGDDGQGADPVTCRPELRPVVMVHGFLASADTWTLR